MRTESVILLVMLPMIAAGLNVLVLLPCHGGHFTAVTTIIMPVCKVHNCTVLEIGTICEKKLKPIREKVDFEYVQRHVFSGDFEFESFWDAIVNSASLFMEVDRKIGEVFDQYFTENRDKIDVFIGETGFTRSIIMAEKHNIPIVLSCSVEQGGVESLQEKIHQSSFETILIKLMMYDAVIDDIIKLRQSYGLPAIDDQGGFTTAEYFGRFPMIFPTTPNFFPRPHPSATYHFIGAMRNEEVAKPLSPEMLQWMKKDKTPLVYISLGTHTVLAEEVVKEFVDAVNKQSKLKFIFSMSAGLEKVITAGGFESNDKLLFSKYLPQYTLLGHPDLKVFVSHGGSGSTIDSIKLKMPLILFPQMGDQVYNAKVVVDNKGGIQIDEFKYEKIEAAYDEIMKDYSSYKTQLGKMADDFNKHENPADLNKFIEKIAAKKKVTMIEKLPFEVNTPANVKAYRIFIWSLYGMALLGILSVVGIGYCIKRCCFSAKPKTEKKD